MDNLKVRVRVSGCSAAYFVRYARIVEVRSGIHQIVTSCFSLALFEGEKLMVINKGNALCLMNLNEEQLARMQELIVERDQLDQWENSSEEERVDSVEDLIKDIQNMYKEYGDGASHVQGFHEKVQALCLQLKENSEEAKSN